MEKHKHTSRQTSRHTRPIRSAAARCNFESASGAQFPLLRLIGGLGARLAPTWVAGGVASRDERAGRLRHTYAEQREFGAQAEALFLPTSRPSGLQNLSQSERQTSLSILSAPGGGGGGERNLPLARASGRPVCRNSTCRFCLVRPIAFSRTEACAEFSFAKKKRAARVTQQANCWPGRSWRETGASWKQLGDKFVPPNSSAVPTRPTLGQDGAPLRMLPASVCLFARLFVHSFVRSFARLLTRLQVGRLASRTRAAHSACQAALIKAHLCARAARARKWRLTFSAAAAATDAGEIGAAQEPCTRFAFAFSFALRNGGWCDLIALEARPSRGHDFKSKRAHGRARQRTPASKRTQLASARARLIERSNPFHQGQEAGAGRASLPSPTPPPPPPFRFARALQTGARGPSSA